MDYPYDIITEFSRSKNGGCKTFSISANLIPQTDESPLKIFNPMSRFTTTIIQCGTAASINLHPSDLAQMRGVSDYAMNKYYDTKYNVSGTVPDCLSPAYTTRFMLGKLKGKTPVDVLIENGEQGKTILNDQYKFLKANIDKYPKNKDLLDAIKEAAALDVSDLKKSSQAPLIIPILEIGCRGNVRKKRADGKCPCFDGNISFDLSRNLPVTIHIRNYYAPIKINESGTQNVILSGADTDSIISNDFSMTAECWLKCLKEMEDITMLFKMRHAVNAFSLADKAFKDNVAQASSRMKRAS